MPMGRQTYKVRLSIGIAEAKQALHVGFCIEWSGHQHIVGRYAAFTDKVVKVLTLIVNSVESK